MPAIVTAKPPRRHRKPAPAAVSIGPIVTARNPRKPWRVLSPRIGGQAAADAADRLWRELVRRATGG